MAEVDKDFKVQYLVYTRNEWLAFLAGAKEDEFTNFGDGEGLVAVRDSKDPKGLILVFQPAHHSLFIEQIKAGKYDLPDTA